jgi:D-alanine--D-alanine ligase
MRTHAEIQSSFADRNVLDAAERLYLVGIAGAGMSGLARLARDRGLVVAGSDSTPGDEVSRLVAEGFSVTVGHDASNIEGFRPDVIVLTDAIDLNDSPEVAAAHRLGVPLLRRSQLLGWLTRNRRVIAITGTHGKTTTTGFVGAGLMAAGFDPLVIVGAVIPQWDGPIHFGKGEWAVVEACEAYDSFHDLDPEIVILTNLEPDHLDFHGTWAALEGSVDRFVARIPSQGWLIYCEEDSGASDVARRFAGQRVGYRFDPQEAAELSVPGRHNQLNMLGALEACVRAGADRSQILPAMNAFLGAERRLQVLHDGDVTLIDDYAHHPTEISASIQALRERYGDRRLVVVFQPHLYSRTAEHLAVFAAALDAADQVVLTDIYPAREAPMPGMSSARIAELMVRDAFYVPSRHLLPRFVAKMRRPGDVIVGMGAGNIANFGPRFLDELSRGGQTKVLVLSGGDSAEREISLLSGLQCAAALTEAGFEVSTLDVTDRLFSTGTLADLAGANRPDVVFLALHGTRGEDGAIQGLLELLHLPYTGSGIQASAIAMDKALTKLVLSRAGIRSPLGIVLRRGDSVPEVPFHQAVVKPNAQGSTVGLSFVEDIADLGRAVERAFRYGDEVLVEEWIRGTEISVPVLNGGALHPVEIVPKSGQYDFANKYTPGATEEIIPARLSPEVEAEAKRLATLAHVTLGCEGATRTDMIVRDDEIFVLEVNTLPGMTKTSLLPNSASVAGISFVELCRRLVDDAQKRAEKAAFQ